jgi:hypothetical protein
MATGHNFISQSLQSSKPPMVQEAHHTEIAFRTISDQKFLNGILNFKRERKEL